VILDLMLPDANGLEILSKIRASSSRPDTPVIILTAKGQDTDREAAMAGGANDFMTKPFSPKKLIARIDEILAEG
jgi:DNA-binding response OmpR family regulator